MKRRTTPALLAMLALLAGCSSSAPKCSDQATVDTVIELVTQAVNQNLAVSVALNALGREMHSRLEAITTAEVDKKTGTQFCEALLIHVVTENGKVVSTTDGESIEYKSYLDDDGKHYVMVYGL